MALYGAVQGSRPGLKEHSIQQATVGPNEETMDVEFGNFMQSVEDVQVSFASPQSSSAALVHVISVVGTTVTIGVLNNAAAAATTVATFNVSAIGEALR